MKLGKKIELRFGLMAVLDSYIYIYIFFLIPDKYENILMLNYICGIWLKMIGYRSNIGFYARGVEVLCLKLWIKKPFKLFVM